MARYVAGSLEGMTVTAVYCDGTLLSDVYEADDELGFAVVSVRDADGEFKRSGDAIARRVVTGVIQVELAD